MSINVLAIINPASGKGNILSSIDEIKDNLINQNMQVNMKLTKKEYNAKKIVEENINGIDLLLVCGGDGTLNEVVTALMEKEIQDLTIAYIPLGTTNDLAKSLDIPIKDISVTKRLLQSKAKIIDIGKINNTKYFCYVTAFGVFTDVSYKTSQKAKNKYGKLAYYVNAIKELIKIPKYKVKISFDDEELEGEFIYGGITNSESIAGFRWFDRNDIDLNDGKFECIFIRKPKKISGYFKLWETFKQKDYSWNRDIVYIQANKMKIEINKKVPWTIDGEYAGDMDKIYVENCNGAIELAICEQNIEKERDTNAKKSNRK